MDEMSIFCENIALTTLLIELSFASCKFPITLQFFPNCTLVLRITNTNGNAKTISIPNNNTLHYILIP